MVLSRSSELRYMMADTPYRTLARTRVQVTSTAATVTAPASVAAGATFAVRWQGPNNPRDFITIVPAGTGGARIRRVRLRPAAAIGLFRYFLALAAQAQRAAASPKL
jgi:hypothetical protein